MLKQYEYNGIAYASEQDVRKALFESKKIALGKTPSENVAEFWAKYGVIYTEEQEPVEFFKQQKSLVIKQAFLDWRNNQATLISSLGFKADSNERAKSDVDGLIDLCENKKVESVTFRDADNSFHELMLSELMTLKLEIIENGNHAYAQKWALDAQVESATTKEELDAIVVKFEGKNFLEG